jgi:hypothetical protein
MKNQNRIRLNGSPSSPAAQGQPLPPIFKNAPGSALLPKSLAAEVKGALEEFQRAGGAAMALCMMNGDSLRDAMRAFQPKEPCPAAWNKFCDLIYDDPIIRQGMIELSLQQVSEFKRCLTAWSEYQIGMVRGEKCSNTSFGGIEDAVMSLGFLLRSQGEVLLSYYPKTDQNSGESCGAMSCGFAVTERLNAAWRKSWLLSNKLQDVFGGGQVAVN